MFGTLDIQPPDPLLALISDFARDDRHDKIDVGVGVYRDESGRTPVFRSVSQAEHRLVQTQSTKSYLGPEGNLAFLDALAPIVFGDIDPGDRLSAIQTPGGTGALRLAAELIGASRPRARIHVGEPTWPNHVPILNAGGLDRKGHEHYDVAAGAIRFDAVMAALGKAERGDLVLLHASCHNPTGCDFDLDQWKALAGILSRRGIVPVIDMAYQGLGDGFDADASGARLVLDSVDEALVAYSCDKNFGLYRERVGALFVLSRTPGGAGVVQSNLLALARANWSMPPDHGAAVVAAILADPALEADWREELDSMAARIRSIRGVLSSSDGRLAHLARQKGMFGMLPLTPAAVEALRNRHAVYMPLSGRINIAGLVPSTVGPFVAALDAVW